MPNHVVLGHMGEVGSAVYDFLREVDPDVYGYDKKDKRRYMPKQGVPFLHVCIPYYFGLGEFVKDFASKLKAEHIIVYSSVLPGTIDIIGDNAVHSPIEGRHPHLKESFKTFTRFVAGKNSEVVAQYFRNRGLTVKTFPDAKTTELGKMLSTTRYGLNLVFADTEKKLCDKYGIDYNDVVLKYQEMYNEGYKTLEATRFTQPILTPPNGKIGGHCVTSNANILTKISDCDLIRRVAEYGKEGVIRSTDIQDGGLSGQVSGVVVQSGTQEH